MRGSKLLESAGFIPVNGDKPAGEAGQTAAPGGATPASTAAPAAAAALPVPAAVPGKTPDSAASPAAQPATLTEPEILKMIFGDSEAPVKSIKEIGASFTRFNEVNTEREKLTTKVKELEPANSYVASLNAAIKAGISKENFDAAQLIDASKADPREALVLMNMMKAGLTREQAEFWVDDTYKLSPEFKGQEDTNEVKKARIALQMDTKEALTYLDGHKVKIMEAPGEARLRDITAAWTPVIPSVVDGLKVDIALEDGVLPFPITQKMKDAALKQATELMAMPSFDLLPEGDGLAKLQETLQLALIRDNFTEIVKFLENDFKVKAVTKKSSPDTLTGGRQESAVITSAADDELADSLVKQIKKGRGGY